MTRTWPEDWESRKRGDACPLCGDFTQRSFHSGGASEALLEPRAIAPGHVVVVFRGRHVTDLGDLTAEELAQYWRDIQHVSRAVQAVFDPCHVNYLSLGNQSPHLHVHIVPRYLDDAAPGMPLPWAPVPVPEAAFAEQFARLREMCHGEPGEPG
jgi:diadenosine tetraphosphate (Ap4A) HIT family hydrolase